MKRNECAGLVVYRRRRGRLEVLLVHPGGPYFTKKDAGSWSIPKGTIERGQTAIETAKREFSEETGFSLPAGDWLALGSIMQKSKTVTAWAAAGDYNAADATSNSFRMEWPPRSGKFKDFPEVDKAEWFGIDEAAAKMVPGQDELLRRLVDQLGDKSKPDRLADGQVTLL